MDDEKKDIDSTGQPEPVNGQGGQPQIAPPQQPPDLWFWSVTLKIPFRKKLIRRASAQALEMMLAKALTDTVFGIPDDFFKGAVIKIKTDLKKEEPLLIIPNGRLPRA